NLASRMSVRALDIPNRSRRKPKRLKKILPDQIHEITDELSPGTPVELWFQDEMRVGQKNSTVYQWARRGTRPRQPADQRYANAYLFGALCPQRDTGAALVLPQSNTYAMELHLAEISATVASGAHAIVLMDQAGWHTTSQLKVPDNLSLVFIPPATPELNPAENVWQYLRQTYLSNRIFKDYDDIVDRVCQAWRALLNEPGRITSITYRTWARVNYS